jgi:hypothetical protein
MSKPNQHNIERLNWKIIIEKKDQNVKKKEHSKKINNKKGQEKGETLFQSTTFCVWRNNVCPHLEILCSCKCNLIIEEFC